MGNTDNKTHLMDKVVSTAKRIENIESEDEFEPVEVQFVVGLNGTVQEVIAITATGGPHIEANLTTGSVHGRGYSNRHRTHFKRTDTIDCIEEFYRGLFKSTAVQ